MFARVVLFDRIDKPLDYAVPADWAPGIQPGCRVLVPLRNKLVGGVVLGLTDRSSIRDPKPIASQLDQNPIVPAWLLELMDWTTRYYLAGWGSVLRVALPAGLIPHVYQTCHATDEGRAVAGKPSRSEPGIPAQILQAIVNSRAGLSLDGLERRFGRRPTTQAIGRFRRLGRIEVRVRPAEGFSADALDESAIHIQTASGVEPSTITPKTSVLHGPSAAARELQILEAIREQTDRHKRVLLLVPEIRRAQAWLKTIQDRLPLVRPALLFHGQIPDAERWRRWRRIAAGEVPLVIGTRSACFCPLPDPGLIIVDDEADAAHKQEDAPRLHAREVAVARAERQKSDVLITANYPTVETFCRIKSGNVTEIQSGPAEPTGRCDIVDLGGLPADQILSGALREEIKMTLSGGNRAVLLLNRRGFSGALACRDCAGVIRCTRCSVALVFHKDRGRLLCHHCAIESAPPTACSTCKGTQFSNVGFGLERVGEALASSFPDARSVLVDRESSLPIRDGDVIVGTDILLRLPRPARTELVAILDADQALQFPHFRAAEDAFQIIARVRQYAGPARTIVQTRHPDRPSIAWVIREDAAGFYEAELSQRKSLDDPPFSRLIALTIRGANSSLVSADAAELARRIQEEFPPSELLVRGPAPAALSRIRANYRERLLLKLDPAADPRDRLQDLLDGFRPTRGIRLEVDVDPVQIF